MGNSEIKFEKGKYLENGDWEGLGTFQKTQDQFNGVWKNMGKFQYDFQPYKGFYKYASGYQYHGSLVNMLKHGEGSLFEKDKFLIYDGEW